MVILKFLIIFFLQQFEQRATNKSKHYQKFPQSDAEKSLNNLHIHRNSKLQHILCLQILNGKYNVRNMRDLLLISVAKEPKWKSHASVTLLTTLDEIEALEYDVF